MAPKKQQQQGSSNKVKEDKTFGLKNKNKSTKVQAQVKLIQQQQSLAGKNREAQMKERRKEEERERKKAEEIRKKEMGELFKPAQVQKVPFGVDPKTVPCAFFKAGNCEKGKKCKFAHTKEPDRKSEKRDLYTDMRVDQDKETDTMDKWDSAKLNQVVLSKHGNLKTTTDIVCKFFIQAIEDGKYGWFWECPNGGEKCKYRHALPPGFVLKSQQKKKEAEEKENEITLEEFLEVERHKLGSNLTPVTAETFAAWKKNRMDKKQAEEEARNKAREAQVKAGKANGMSGRELFQYNPEMYLDEDEEEEDWDLSAYKRDQGEEKAEGEADSSERQENDEAAGRADGRENEQEPKANGVDGQDGQAGEG